VRAEDEDEGLHAALVASFSKHCKSDALDNFPVSRDADQKLRALSDQGYSQRRLGPQGNIARVRLQVGCYWALTFISQVQRGLGLSARAPAAPDAAAPAKAAARNGPRSRGGTNPAGSAASSLSRASHLVASHASKDVERNARVSGTWATRGTWARVGAEAAPEGAHEELLAKTTSTHRRPARSMPREAARVCETGFNAGHSAVVLLSALHSALATQGGAAFSADTNATRVEYVGFDLGDNEWTAPAAQWINRSLFPGELDLVVGDSSKTIPLALGTTASPLRRTSRRGGGGRTRVSLATVPAQCDVVSIDGNHTVGGVVADWLALRHHLNRAYGSLVLFDDVDEDHPVWQQPGLRRIGCVSLSGIADDEPRTVPISASSGFCVAFGVSGSGAGGEGRDR
jgi:hypothetical protein